MLCNDVFFIYFLYCRAFIMLPVVILQKHLYLCTFVPVKHFPKRLAMRDKDDGVTRHSSLAVKQPHSGGIYSRWVLKASFSAPLKRSHLWWLNHLSGSLISWYVVCLLSSRPSFLVCLLLLAALTGLSRLDIFNLVCRSAGAFELILFLSRVILRV